MAILVIRTQVLENYGFMDWDGQGERPQNWKPKGGEIYVVQDVLPDLLDEKDVIDSLENFITQNDDYTQEYIRDFRMYPDGTCTIEYADVWEAPIFLKRTVWINRGERDIFWSATRTNYNDGGMREEIEVKYESWVLKPNNDKGKYNAYYKMINGDVYNHEQLEQYYKGR